MRNRTFTIPLTVWGVEHMTSVKKEKKPNKLRDVISSPEQFFCFLDTLANKRCVEGKKLIPSGGEDSPDNDWRQLNKPSRLTEREREMTQKQTCKHQNLSCCTPPQMRRRETQSLTRCCPSLFACEETRWGSSVSACRKLCRGKRWAFAGRGRGEDVVTSHLKPRDGAC